MLTLKTILTGLTVATVAATAAMSGGHDASPEEKAVSARQVHMQLYSFNLGTLGAMAKGGMDFDADAAQGAADNLVALATMSQGAYWIPGTSSTDVDGSRALAALWETYPAVAENGKAMVDAAMAMQANAGSLEGVQSSMGALGGACGACHKAYRAPAN